MSPPKTHRALYVTLLGLLLGCGDATSEGASAVGAQAAIVGGWAASDSQIFATVELRRSGAESGFCSGALISPSVVVTAAHCAVVEPEVGEMQPAPPGGLWVAAGHLVSRKVHSHMVRDVVEIRIHEDYDHDFIMGRSRAGAGQGGIGSPNDIALLFLDEPYDDLPLAPLLTPSREEALVRHGDVGFVAGYGVYDVDEGLGGELYISDAVIDIIGTRELLTRRSDQLGDSCYGDSGGPLYVPTEEGDFLVGLVSRGRSDVKRDCGDGGIYTLVSSHFDWMASAAGDRFAPITTPVGEAMTFVEDGADPISVPKGGSLRGARTCAVSGPDGDTSIPISLIALWAGAVWWSRRLSRC